MKTQETSVKILSIAREILASDGFGAISFDAIAQRLGRSKQAVLYWYPTKRDLLNAMFLPWLSAEAEAAEDAVSDVVNETDAITAFIRAVAAFHFQDLDRFRMMYLIPQTITRKSNSRGKVVAGENLYEITDRLYGALADHLEGGREDTRKRAVAIHSAVLGIVLMFALADALVDPLKHSETALIDTLIKSFTTTG